MMCTATQWRPPRFGRWRQLLSLLASLSLNLVRSQSPVETLNRGWGSCQDFAMLFAEAARILGFGARIVSGYLYNPDQQGLGSAGAGSTHAWAEVFVPGAGWITFDPTNEALGAANLVPVAVARDIRLALPVTGSFVGGSNAFKSMSVEVNVRAA